MAQERIDKLLARQGFGSRKDVKKILHKCEVTVNGVRCTASDTHIDPDADEVCVDGECITFIKELYLMMNKKGGTVCSTKDGEHETVFDCLEGPEYHAYETGRLHFIGRLDIDTEGLLILTTDGELTHRLISPKNDVSKTYYAELEKSVDSKEQAEIAEQFKKGIEVPRDGREDAFLAKSADIEWVSENSARLTITEGKFHQVKRMFLAVNNKVIFLKRIKEGKLSLDPDLAKGSYRPLTAEELDALKAE